MARKAAAQAAEPDAAPMGRNPFADDDEILTRTFYQRDPAAAPVLPERPPAKPAQAAPKRRTAARREARQAVAPPPTHYKVLSISLYTEDIQRLDDLVAQLKAAGHPKANRSALIRFALDTVDITTMPRSYGA